MRAPRSRTGYVQEQVNIGSAPPGSKVKWFRSASDEPRFINTVTFDSKENAPTLVMVHGYGASQGFFFRNFDALANRFRVIAIDQFGWGGSSRPDFDCRSTQETEAWFIDSFEEWRKAKNFSNFILLGHSFGGYVATNRAPFWIGEGCLPSLAPALVKRERGTERDKRKGGADSGGAGLIADRGRRGRGSNAWRIGAADSQLSTSLFASGRGRGAPCGKQELARVHRQGNDASTASRTGAPRFGAAQREEGGPLHVVAVVAVLGQEEEAAYGQTRSGKTHTMLDEISELGVKPGSECGMAPRIFQFLIARIRAEEESRRDENLKYNCKCSFLEIYNEQITDLLDSSSTKLQLREDTRVGVYVENLTKREVTCVSDIITLLMQGSVNRKVYAREPNIMRYIKIAAMLPNRTIRDVALRCSGGLEKVFLGSDFR
ncbi:Abhydrolase domain-containing protein 4 [Hordeum vulgare]|nr:Abhydrolase domain-containing protein 4 [Hordeum vulgare]